MLLYTKCLEATHNNNSITIYLIMRYTSAHSLSPSRSVSEAAAAAFVTGACLLVYYLAWPMNIVIEEEIGI